MNKLISVFKYNCIYILANSVGSNVYLYRYIGFIIGYLPPYVSPLISLTGARNVAIEFI